MDAKQKQALMKLLLALEVKRAAETAQHAPEMMPDVLAENLGIEAQVTKIDDMDAYLEQRAKAAGLIAPCINPYCTRGKDGQPAVVDRRKRTSGACCKACMNYECTHPDCVARAQKEGWKRPTHAWGTKIATAHKEYRKA